MNLFYYQEEKPINPRDNRSGGDNIRINHRIRAPQVRLIGADGAQLGVMDTRKALELAMNAGLDLAEISPTSSPPVCKILDYGKYKYQQKKKAQQSKKNQVVTVLKEVQFRPQTGTHDIEYKVKHVKDFLEDGNKVKVSIRFRGREMAHTDLGYALLKQIIDMVGSLGIVEQNSKMEGKALSLIFAPAGKVGTKKVAKPAETGEVEKDKKVVPTPAKQAVSAVKSEG